MFKALSSKLAMLALRDRRLALKLRQDLRGLGCRSGSAARKQGLMALEALRASQPGDTSYD